jgi:zinc protease
MAPDQVKRLVRPLAVFFVAAIVACLAADDLQAMPPVQRTVLPNGLVLLVSEEHSLPVVTLKLLLDAGSRRDPAGKEGLASLTANGLLLGTARRSAEAFNEELDSMGASLDAGAGRDYATLSLQVLTRDLDHGFNLFMEALTQPTFPDEELRKEVQQTLAAVQAADDQPEEVAEKAFDQVLFLKSPYAHPVEGTAESLPRISADDVRRFHRTCYRPNVTVLAVVGDVTTELVQGKLIPRLTAWQAGTVPAEQFTATFAEGPKREEIDRAVTQATIVLGHRGISRDNPDYYALAVMNYILGGGGFGSRLVDEIRVKRGLAYSVASFFDARKYPGSFQVVLQTKNASAREAIALVFQEMEKMGAEPVSEEELSRAKKYLTGSFPLRLDTQGKLAGFLTLVEYFGLGLDYPERYPSLINAVTREEVIRVAKAYLRPEKAIIVVVADLKEAGFETGKTKE